MRAALAAYYRATGDCTAPIADPHPVSWSDPECFMETLCDFMALRLRCEAAADGHPVDAEPERLSRWLSNPVSRDLHIRDVDPGLWATVTLHPRWLIRGWRCIRTARAKTRRRMRSLQTAFAGPARAGLASAGDQQPHSNA